jgi:hypothetical protein
MALKPCCSAVLSQDSPACLLHRLLELPLLQLGAALRDRGAAGMLYFVFNRDVIAVVVAHNLSRGEFVAQVTGAVLCCAVLRCAVLRCAVLCCAVPCCAVLRYAVASYPAPSPAATCVGLLWGMSMPTASSLFVHPRTCRLLPTCCRFPTSRPSSQAQTSPPPAARRLCGRWLAAATLPWR